MKLKPLIPVALLTLSGCYNPHSPDIASSWQGIDPSFRTCMLQYDYQETLAYDEPSLAPGKAACRQQLWQGVSPFMKYCLSTDPLIQVPDYVNALPSDPRLATAMQTCEEREGAVQRDDAIQHQKAVQQDRQGY